MQFTKIKYDGTQVELHIKSNTQIQDDKEIREFTSKDLPLPSFKQCFDDLKPYVEEILSLPEGYMADSSITSVSISHKESGESVIITCTKKLDDIGRAFNFNTPLLPMQSETDGPALPEGCDNVIEKLIFEAKSFYEGLRQEEPNLFNKGA
ncbi:MAG: hypothetical protein KIT33_15075 [Candidatus Kapabacteria bacterium]|nr:hypothetical protein [Ignavibacteriota bacterium]MCW5886292.1 hypothetical protein [Candidatus Kapabacteria bacterium]